MWMSSIALSFPHSSPSQTMQKGSMRLMPPWECSIIMESLMETDWCLWEFGNSCVWRAAAFGIVFFQSKTKASSWTMKEEIQEGGKDKLLALRQGF